MKLETMQAYTVQVEVEMHEGPSINDVVTVSAASEEDAMDAVESNQLLLDAIADEHGGYDVVMCVSPQLAMEGVWVSPEKWLSDYSGP